MNIKIHSTELNRMMKTIRQCIDSRSQNFGNIEITHNNNKLTIRSTNGQFSAIMSTPLLGGDVEKFCVDGELFARVCAMCKGEIAINTEDGKNCVIKGNGRTRLPIVEASIPDFVDISEGDSITVNADDLDRGYGGVAHAISGDQSNRIVLTGILMDVKNGTMKMVALDGFKMAYEDVDYEGDDMKIVVPGAFVKLVCDSVAIGEAITLKSYNGRIQVQTEDMTLFCPLLAGEFPDYERIMPTSFTTETLVNIGLLRDALKSSSVICDTSKLVKLAVGKEEITVSGNTEQADYEANIPCGTNGNELKIAFNLKYLMETINSVNAEEIVMMMNTPSSPCVIKAKDQTGARLVLPVRVAR